MLSNDAKRADRRLLLAITAFCLSGPVVLALATWDVIHPPLFDARGWPLSGFVVGLTLVVVGASELVHRVRHGAQERGRRIRRD